MKICVLVLVVLETTSCLAWTNIGASQHSLRHLPISEPPQWRQHRRSGAASLRASADLDNSSVKGSSGGPPPKAEVKAAMVNWAKAVRPEGFSSSRVVVSTGRTLPAVLSQFWTAVADCVEAKYEEERNGDSGFTAQLLFAAPYCELLSDARIMAQVDKTLDFCAGSCVAFGKTVLLQQYHPQLEGGGDAGGGGAAAERRAPFPAFGLRIAPGPVEAEVVSTDKIAQSRMHLELLLNSAASSSSADTIVPAGKRGYCGYPESVPTAESVLTKTKAWAAEVLEGARSQGTAAAAAPPAAAAAAPEGLSLMPSTTGVPTRAGQQPLGGWVADLEMVFQYSISGSRTTEEVLSDLWGTVEEVIAKAAETQCRVLNADGTSHTYSPAISALFVAPRFHSFNAEAFKKFGATLAIVLKQSPILDDMTIELYHPEVIQDDGEVDARRRAPYPTIHFKHVGKKAELFPAPRRSRVAFPAPDADDASGSSGGSAPSGGGGDGSGI
ncbi:hypothetical protein JKP88DRAFT_267546 [Tribonema minus]|uniref:Uncharacterized protein n=1 Tax=Tribonema minus TaxID=303371 RepID=A0A835ZA02_9STRA|nr:hypothetical protein JKP88DRAFT_267546 [Tribonema minus]